MAPGLRRAGSGAFHALGRQGGREQGFLGFPLPLLDTELRRSQRRDPASACAPCGHGPGAHVAGPSLRDEGRRRWSQPAGGQDRAPGVLSLPVPPRGDAGDPTRGQRASRWVETPAGLPLGQRGLCRGGTPSPRLIQGTAGLRPSQVSTPEPSSAAGTHVRAFADPPCPSWSVRPAPAATQTQSLRPPGLLFMLRLLVPTSASASPDRK